MSTCTAPDFVAVAVSSGGASRTSTLTHKGFVATAVTTQTTPMTLTTITATKIGAPSATKILRLAITGTTTSPAPRPRRAADGRRGVSERMMSDGQRADHHGNHTEPLHVS